MSRGTFQNRDSKVKSPIKFWISWKGDVGKFQWWDGEKNVQASKLEMVYIDKRATVTGWNDECQARIYANSVKSINDEITVRTKNKVLAKGQWKEIKESTNQQGGNFTVNVYALAKIDDSEELEPVCLQLDKSCLMAWTDFLEKHKLWELYKGLLTITRGEEQKKGKVRFFVTDFKLGDIDPELHTKAQLFDVEYLQPYLQGEKLKEEKAPF